jgi:isopenicillin-N N-acyltransferase-like protein
MAQPLLLQGAPYERGLAHGETLRGQIHEVVGRWKGELAHMYQMDADEAIARFIGGTGFAPAIRRWTPDLLDEIRGIAAGADMAWETILAFQLLDEMWSNEDVFFAEHCSSLGLPAHGSEPAYVAQNVDVESFRDGFQVLLHIKHADSDLESFVLSTAGLIGFNGINNRSVGICCNALVPLRGCRDGLPVACIIRGVLKQRSEEKAVTFLRTIRHASGQNYIVGGPAQVVDLECSANQVVPFEPDGPRGVVWHTNHPLVNDDCNPWYRAESNPFLPNSTARYQSMEHRLAHPSQDTRLDRIKEILTSKDSTEHPICGSKGEDEFYTRLGMFTFASTIMVLGEDPALHVSFGPPDSAPYRRFVFGKPAVS